jgi:hypothetical protein
MAIVLIESHLLSLSDWINYEVLNWKQHTQKHRYFYLSLHRGEQTAIDREF